MLQDLPFPQNRTLCLIFTKKAMRKSEPASLPSLLIFFKKSLFAAMSSFSASWLLRQLCLGSGTHPVCVESPSLRSFLPVVHHDKVFLSSFRASFRFPFVTKGFGLPYFPLCHAPFCCMLPFPCDSRSELPRKAVQELQVKNVFP